MGTGGASLGAAKLYFLLASYATVLVLTRLLDPATFGSYSAVARLVAVPNMVIIYTLMFTVSRPLAATYERDTPNYTAIRRRGFRLALLAGGAVSLSFFAGAPIFASLLADPDLTDAIRVVAPISLVYALYAVNVGTINARRGFTRQAGLDIFMATAKASLIILAAYLGLGLAHTLGGFTVASILACALSAWWVRKVRPAAAPNEDAGRPLAGLAGALVLFTMLTNLLLATDLFVLKHYAITHALKEAVGFYSGAQYIAQVPYSLLNAMSLLMFPLVATLHADGESERLRAYVYQAARVILVSLGLMGSVAVAAAPSIMALLFPPSYGVVAEQLRYVVVGYCGYSLVINTAWMLNSSERARVAVTLVGVTFGLSALGCVWLGQTYGSAGVAWAVAGAGVVGGVGALAALRASFLVTVGWLWMLRLAACVGCVVAVGPMWNPTTKPLIVVQLCLLTAVFIATALGAKVITLEEIRSLRKRG